MRKTSVNLDEVLHLRLRNLSAKEHKPMSEIINILLDEALRARSGTTFLSHGALDNDDVPDDLAINNEKYLRELFR